MAPAEPPISFREFVGRVSPRYVWYRHSRALADVLQRVADGEIKRLMIFMPPRHGKSEEVSRLFSAYYLYRYPHRWVGINSYGADLAYTLSRAARDNYLRGGGTVRDDAGAVKHWETGKGGGMWAAGVGGPITGKGWHLGIIDDPLKNAEEANSPTIRAKQQDWYGSTFYTREEPLSDDDPTGALIVIQTRWHEADLSGWLLAQESDEEASPERWHVVCLEAIKEAEPAAFPPTCTVEPDWREPGEALCPERRPAEKLRAIARRIGSYFFGALFQQRPRPAEGNTFKRPWFRYWRREGASYRLTAPDGSSRVVAASDCWRFGTVDLAFSTRKTADYTVVAAWAVTPRHDLLLLDLRREQMEGPDIVPAMREMVERHDLQYLGVEQAGAQLALIQEARRKGMTVRALRPVSDKITRAVPATVRCEAGQLYFPQGAAWLGDYETELLTFPNGAHDDMVDATSYAAIECDKRGPAAETDEDRAAREAAEEAAAKAEADRKQAEWEAGKLDDPNIWEGVGW